MKITFGGHWFQVIDTKEKITIADSFVVRQNKIGGGNGEAKLYVGSDNQFIRDFFGGISFKISCIMVKQDLIKYLEETKPEYLNPEQPYVNRELLPNLWKERRKKMDSFPDILKFEVYEQTQILGPRVYINSNDKEYNLIRELSLPNITYISIIKIIDENKEILYYFRLFADYFGEVQHPSVIENDEEEIENIENERLRLIISRARIGQGEYRKKVLELCPFCPITLISDDRILIASHIKPWTLSDNNEKIDPKNGFMLTPTFDYLFDRGFISFQNDKRIILSPFLSNITYSKLGISDNKKYNHLPVDGREQYLDFHRSTILKR